ncbi:hypothetical protein B484DRAFT_461759 [Ochromonadaceae sp. CCMP2298]|nr:hypothetical protein B484DRAFT_461759 [Ochromonadaceae sp. CCMP2298]
MMGRAVTQETQDAGGVGGEAGVGGAWGTEGSESLGISALLSACNGPLSDTFVPAFQPVAARQQLLGRTLHLSALDSSLSPVLPAGGLSCSAQPNWFSSSSSDIPSNEWDAAADLNSSMEGMRVSPGRPPGDELHSLCASLSKEQAVVRLQAEMVRTRELTLQLKAARKALDLATSDQSQIAAVVVMLRSESAGLVKKDSPLCWSSRDEITSYFDLDILGKAEATQHRAKVLWQLLVEGVLNHGTDDVGSARYSPRYYYRGLFSAVSALLKLRSERVNFMPTLNSMYMQACGAPKKMYGYINRQGVADSYDTARGTVQHVKVLNQAAAAACMQSEGSKAHSITADNINIWTVFLHKPSGL